MAISHILQLRLGNHRKFEAATNFPPEFLYIIIPSGMLYEVAQVSKTTLDVTCTGMMVRWVALRQNEHILFVQ